eukprot:39278-Eustigmatos_ZCMA.PRE.1
MILLASNPTGSSRHAMSRRSLNQHLLQNDGIPGLWQAHRFIPSALVASVYSRSWLRGHVPGPQGPAAPSRACRCVLSCSVNDYSCACHEHVDRCPTPRVKGARQAHNH